jgi:hypothetical protein
MILLCILICILKQAKEHPWEIHAIKSEEMKYKLKIIFMITRRRLSRSICMWCIQSISKKEY